jgi:lysophospholipase L1-like esterase
MRAYDMTKRPAMRFSLWRIALVLALSGALCWALLVRTSPLPVGTGPAGPPVPREPFANVWSADETMLLGLGDSITDGFGASPKHSYFELLVENDDTLYPDMKGRDLKHVFPNLEAMNHAVSYTVSRQHLEQQIPRIAISPDHVNGVVVLTSGGNDLIHDYGRSAPRDGAMYGCTYEQAVRWKESFRERLAAIVEAVTNKFPGGCHIFLATIYDPTDGVGDIENANIRLPPWPDGLRVLALLNQVIADVCDSYDNVRLVDIHSLFLGHGIHCTDRRNPYYRKEDPHYWYFDNLEDPNDRGYDAIRRLFLLEMAKICSGTAPSNAVTKNVPPANGALAQLTSIQRN